MNVKGLIEIPNYQAHIVTGIAAHDRKDPECVLFTQRITMYGGKNTRED